MRGSHASTAVASLLSEKDWQGQVCQLLELYGWDWLHVRAGRTNHGWRVATSGTLASGWVDVFAVHAVKQRSVFIELKTEVGRLRPDQKAVHDLLRAAGCEVHVLRPSDLPALLDVLGAPTAGGGDRMPGYPAEAPGVGAIETRGLEADSLRPRQVAEPGPGMPGSATEHLSGVADSSLGPRSVPGLARRLFIEREGADE